MEAQENEKKAYDEACDKREAETAELDKKEIEMLDEEKIDVETFELTETEGKAELADVEDEDEEIDFDAYRIDEDGVCCICQRPYKGFGNNAEPVSPGKCCDACNASVVIPARMQAADDEDMRNGRLPGLNEADAREPLTAIATALGKIASTANLHGENTVRLNESSDYMTVDEVKSFVAKTVSRNEDIRVYVKFAGKSAPVKFDFEMNTDKVLRFTPGDNVCVPFERIYEEVCEGGGCRWKDVADFVFDDKSRNEQQKILRVRTELVSFMGQAARFPSLVFEFSPHAERGKYGNFFDSDEADRGRQLDEADGATEEVEAKTDEMKADPDYPLTDDDWDEIDSLDSVADKVAAIKNLTGFDQLTGKAKENVQADIDFLQGVARQQEASEKWFRRAAYLQDISKKRELSDAEYREMGDILNTKLDDFQKEVLLDRKFANRFNKQTTYVPKGSEQAGHGAFHTGEDAGERAAETGLDQGFTVDNWLNVEEPMQTGEKIEVEYSPSYVSRSDQLTDLATAKKAAAPITREYYNNEILRDRKLAAARRIAGGRGPQDAYVRGQPKRTLSKDAWKFVRDQVDPAELDQIRQEVKAGAATQAERDFADWIFGDLTVTQKMNAAIQGMGCDQSGSTGANTQQGTKMQDFILAQLALYLNVATDEANKMLGVYRKEGVVNSGHGTNGALYLDAAKTQPNPNSARMVRKQLREVLFREIMEEDGFTPSQLMQLLKLNASPDPNGSVSEMKAACQVIGFLLQKELVGMTPADFREFKDAFATYQTKGEVRKFRTHLTDEQNVEYQDILSRMRSDFDSVPEEQKRRFAVLDRIRHGEDPIQAQSNIDRKLEQFQGKPITTDNFFKIIGKKFLHGGSSNVTRDTITLKDQSEEN